MGTLFAPKRAIAGGFDWFEAVFCPVFANQDGRPTLLFLLNELRCGIHTKMLPTWSDTAREILDTIGGERTEFAENA